ncbi:GNAT family N-acetyltransferase [Corynebacterium breve]|uniref:GNAT family N-acetyltransferase n=1 Tax=Corynebacterium breve TaxID=3049799 RepID=A0ABY8VFE5_9CORY|nr:GNAT family N-acetyltransferase [Corynebacterium breve]WIM68219.1 GNAT family N-acetyltransferase [Corynebacterium breve]
MQLLPATESDRTYFARLFFLTDVYGDESRAVSDYHLRDIVGYVDDWNPTRDGGFVVYDENRIPAGGIWFRYWEGPDALGWANLGPDIPELAIAVESRFAGKGISRLLLDAAVDLGRSQGAPALALSVAADNPRARHVYEKFGFTDVADVDGAMRYNL